MECQHEYRFKTASQKSLYTLILVFLSTWQRMQANDWALGNSWEKIHASAKSKMNIYAASKLLKQNQSDCTCPSTQRRFPHGSLCLHYFLGFVGNVRCLSYNFLPSDCEISWSEDVIDVIQSSAVEIPMEGNDKSWEEFQRLRTDWT